MNWKNICSISVLVDNNNPFQENTIKLPVQFRNNGKIEIWDFKHSQQNYLKYDFINSLRNLCGVGLEPQKFILEGDWLETAKFHEMYFYEFFPSLWTSELNNQA